MTEELEARFVRTVTAIKVLVPRIPGATFGYIVTLERSGDFRVWSVFLPHPGRVGTREDRIGSFATGDAAGARAALLELAAFVRGMEYAVA